MIYIIDPVRCKQEASYIASKCCELRPTNGSELDRSFTNLP